MDVVHSAPFSEKIPYARWDGGCGSDKWVSTARTSLDQPKTDFITTFFGYEYFSQAVFDNLHRGCV